MSFTNLPPIAQASAASLGAVTSNTILYPLDLLTTRAQTRSRKNQENLTKLGEISQILAHEGLTGFYKGLGTYLSINV
jgi:solute carrier family 25 (peroxisomal adenine nucleotide transporter), member 17